jgi:hypothetical protein
VGTNIGPADGYLTDLTQFTIARYRNAPGRPALAAGAMTERIDEAPRLAGVREE